MRERKPRDEPVPKRPTHEDFAHGAVQKAVLKETVQHPLTIIPMALGVVGALLTVVTREPLVLLATLGFIGGGGAVWFWNYFGRGETLAQDHVTRLRALQKEHDRNTVESIWRRCHNVRWEDGKKEAGELLEAYRRAKGSLSQKGDGADAVRFEGLADEALREGVELLTRGLATFEAVRQIDVAGLEREKSDWETGLRRAKTMSERDRKAKQAQIDSHARTIEMYNQRQDSLTEIVAKVNAIGNALEQVTLTAPTGTIGDLFSSGGAASQLELAVRAASRVEERLRGIANGGGADDEQYLKQGRAIREEQP